MFCDPKNDPIRDVKMFTAQVILITSPRGIKSGYSPMMYCAASHSRVHVTLAAKLNKKGKVIELNPEKLF